MRYEDFKLIKSVHLASLFRESDKFVSYKNISINEGVREITFLGDWFQFGVFKGQTARILESFVLGQQKLHLFDSFEGLPEDWHNTVFNKGSFKIEDNEIPRFDPARTLIHKGWFSETLPEFVSRYNRPIPFIHLDADLYSSTLTVLEELNALIVPGTILLFDEFFLPTETGISDDECRAFFNWVEKYDRDFQFLWRTEWVQLAIKIIK